MHPGNHAHLSAYPLTWLQHDLDVTSIHQVTEEPCPTLVFREIVHTQQNTQAELTGPGRLPADSLSLTHTLPKSRRLLGAASTSQG